MSVQNYAKLDVCRDFQSRGCPRRGCRFAHVTREEEEIYAKSGILPFHAITNARDDYNGILGKRNYDTMLGTACRDFEKGKCKRGSRCRFSHPKLSICRDFQNDKCDRSNCRYLHMTREEEETYDNKGILPDHIDREEAMKKRLMIAPSSTRKLTMGEERGYHLVSNPSFAALLQENEALKTKLTEMSQQIMDLRKMNDTLYEQNSNYRNGYK